IVAVSAQMQVRIGAVEIGAEDRVAHHEVMSSPSVVASDSGARVGRLECPAEVRQRELGHPIGNAELDGRLVERGHCLADLGPQSRLVAGLSSLIVMRVEPPERDEENLAVDVGQELSRGLDQLRDLPQLIAYACVREKVLPGWIFGVTCVP